ncbi:hypothetical protein SESBI_03515 [Sesbania bispinosa]|nr:hypothetical protein SESBI_03515 [Sesbania bispinosa]
MLKNGLWTLVSGKDLRTHASGKSLNRDIIEIAICRDEGENNGSYLRGRRPIVQKEWGVADRCFRILAKKNVEVVVGSFQSLREEEDGK